VKRIAATLAIGVALVAAGCGGGGTQEVPFAKVQALFQQRADRIAANASKDGLQCHNNTTLTREDEGEAFGTLHTECSTLLGQHIVRSTVFDVTYDPATGRIKTIKQTAHGTRGGEAAGGSS